MKCREEPMMVTIPVKARLGADGVVSLRVSTGLPESNVEVVLTVRPAAPPVSSILENVP